MIRKIKRIVFLVLLAQSAVSYAQVGMGTENPTADEYEVKGSVRFRSLEHKGSATHSRELRSDNLGRLTVVESKSEEGLYFSNLVKQFMTETVTVPLGYPQDLGVLLRVDLKPYSETTVILSYNIPVFMKVTTASPVPHFAAVQLNRKREGLVTPLYGGSRKFSFPVSYPGDANELKGMFLDGKYVDVIQNNSPTPQTVEYSLFGIIQASSFTAAFFGDDPNNTQVGNMGVGVFSAMIFNKTY